MKKRIHYSTDEKWGVGFVFIGNSDELAAELVKIDAGCGWAPGSAAAIGYDSVAVDEVDTDSAEAVHEACELAVRLGWYTMDQLGDFYQAAETVAQTIVNEDE